LLGGEVLDQHVARHVAQDQDNHADQDQADADPEDGDPAVAA